MKTATPILLTVLCAALAAAKPLDKRALVTTIEYITVTATVTGFPPADTAAPVDPSAWSDWQGGRGSGRGGDGRGPGNGNGGIDATTVTIPAAEPSSTSEAVFTPPAFTPPVESQPTSEPPAAQPTSEATTAPTQDSAPAPAPTSISSDYQQGILDSHNIHRANHSVSDLVWDDKLTNIAAQIAASCVYAHDTSTGGGGYGQNIGAGSPPEDIPAMITNLMYNNEIGFYPGYGSEPSMTDFHQWGHFSQIVWKSTTSVGCATQYCPNGLANTGGGVSPYFTVCNYGPPGNFGGQYAANVLAPLGHPTVQL